MKNNFSDCHCVRFSVHVLMFLTVQFGTLINTLRSNTPTPSLGFNATSEPYHNIIRCSARSPSWCYWRQKIKNITTSEKSAGRAFQARNIPEKRRTHHVHRCTSL